MSWHTVLNSVVIMIVALACVMNAMNINSIINVVSAQNKVLMDMAVEIEKQSQAHTQD